MDAKTTIGQFVRWARENSGRTQQQLAGECGITYQYLSGVENGRENFTAAVLEGLATALGLTVPRLVIEAYYGATSATPAPRVSTAYFRPAVPLPTGLTIHHLVAAADEAQRLIHLINASLTATGGEPLPRYIQANNFSGIVSNILSDALHRCSPYHHNSAQQYPDLACRDAAGNLVGGLEVKATIRRGKGGESHNGHSGWHLIAHFTIDESTGDVLFRHLMIADLNGHSHPDPDWKYQGSKVKEATGSQRTETYITTAGGTAKLRHGSVYLDHAHVSFRKWRPPPGSDIPLYSILHPDYRPGS